MDTVAAAERRTKSLCQAKPPDQGRTGRGRRRGGVGYIKDTYIMDKDKDGMYNGRKVDKNIEVV